MVKLTPGSRRKPLRHINEGKQINELATEMGLWRRTINRLIYNDTEIGNAWVTASETRKDIALAKASAKIKSSKKYCPAERDMMRAIIVREPTTAYNSAKEIMANLAELNGLTMADLTGQSRARHVSLVRQTAMYEIRQQLQYSLPRIGQLFGGRDHTTILHGINKIAEIRRRINHSKEQVAA
ncbi:helix-turn-helix domain-containing protein [Paenochrobactrum sp. BZR 201-1]